MEIAVIGGGPGGYVAAIRAAQLGASVTLVEKQHLGGTCLNIGCIPTKCLLHSAELLSDIRDQGKAIGIEATDVRVNFQQVIQHKNEISKKLTGGIASLLKANKIKKIDGEAYFQGKKKVNVLKNDGTEEALTADAYILATGSVNALPPIPGIKDNPNCIVCIWSRRRHLSESQSNRQKKEALNTLSGNSQCPQTEKPLF